MKVTFLGTGTSQGVPIIGCDCNVCKSTNPKDKRLRSSIFLEIDNQKIVIDTGTDFRQQLLNNHIEDIDAIIYTHEHKDHIAGLDDIRPINYLKKKDIPIYAEHRVLEALKGEFHYAFAEIKYPGLPKLTTHEIQNTSFQINQTTFQPIRVMHHKLPVFGYRINDFAYITDANFIASEELDKLKNLDVLVINALRYESHISHFTFDEALAIIEQLQPKQAYLTHISHLLDLHDVVNAKLPAQIRLAYDGLVINC